MIEAAHLLFNKISCFAVESLCHHWLARDVFSSGLLSPFFPLHHTLQSPSIVILKVKSGKPTIRTPHFSSKHKSRVCHRNFRRYLAARKAKEEI